VYELNPAVLDIAVNQFTYLKDSKAQVQPVLGDARLPWNGSSRRAPSIGPSSASTCCHWDAFSGMRFPCTCSRGGLCPTARDQARRRHRLSPFQRYLNLPPVVEQIARAAGFQAVPGRRSPEHVRADCHLRTGARHPQCSLSARPGACGSPSGQLCRVRACPAGPTNSPICSRS